MEICLLIARVLSFSVEKICKEMPFIKNYNSVSSITLPSKIASYAFLSRIKFKG